MARCKLAVFSDGWGCDLEGRGIKQLGLIMKRYMVIETFASGCKEKVYQRFHAQGRMLPDGLTYIDSWLEKDGNRCFQLMQTSDESSFTTWTDQWKDLVHFEIVELGEKPPKGR